MTHTIQKDGTSIDCVSFGSGTRPLVMLPGLSLQRVRGAALNLRLMYREFGRTHMVYVIDKKDTVPDGYTIRDIAGVTAARPNPVMEEAVNGWISLARAGDYPTLIRDMLPKMYSERYIKKYGRLLPLLSRIGKPKKEDMERFINLAGACLTCDAYPELHRISCPALVLGGGEDRVLTGEASRELAKALSCELHIYDTLGHAAYEEAGDFNQRILRFFTQ